ncbi:MAG: hypothetical protein LUQ31_02285 [Methanoregula sp.]|nr:hypothetical protein [Methanoregula sp.]
MANEILHFSSPQEQEQPGQPAADRFREGENPYRTHLTFEIKLSRSIILLKNGIKRLPTN